MTESKVLAVYVVTIILVVSLFESTTKAGLAQRDEPMTIVLNSNDYPEDEIKYVQENNNFTDMPNDELFVDDSVTTTPKEHTMRSTTESPSVPPVDDDQATKSTTRTMTMNTKTTTTTTTTNSTTVTSTSTPTTMSSTTTTALTISSTSTMSGTRH